MRLGGNGRTHGGREEGEDGKATGRWAREGKRKTAGNSSKNRRRKDSYTGAEEQATTVGGRGKSMVGIRGRAGGPRTGLLNSGVRIVTEAPGQRWAKRRHYEEGSRVWGRCKYQCRKGRQKGRSYTVRGVLSKTERIRTGGGSGHGRGQREVEDANKADGSCRREAKRLSDGGPRAGKADGSGRWAAPDQQQPLSHWRGSSANTQYEERSSHVTTAKDIRGQKQDSGGRK